MKRYVIKSRLRFVLSVCLIMIFAVSSLFTFVVNARSNNDMSMVPEYVEEGDTLWSMSKHYVGDMDIREYISRVMDVNELTSANIKPGELLYFPQYN